MVETRIFDAQDFITLPLGSLPKRHQRIVQQTVLYGRRYRVEYSWNALHGYYVYSIAHEGSTDVLVRLIVEVGRTAIVRDFYPGVADAWIQVVGDKEKPVRPDTLGVDHFVVLQLGTWGRV